MFVGEADRCTEVAKLEIFYKFVMGREPAWRTLQFAGVVPVEKFADRTPILGARHDRVANLEQRWGLGMPQARRGETSSRLKMEIIAGRMNVFSAMGKSHGGVRFVGTLVMRKSRVAVNAEHGTARRARICDKVRRDFRKWRSEICDETQDGLANAGFPFFFVLLEPVATVVALETGEKTEKIGTEISGHWRYGKKERRKSKVRARRGRH